MKKYNLFLGFFLIFLLACEEPKKTVKETTEKEAEEKPLPGPRSINQTEKTFVERWSTVFKDVNGNLVAPKNTSGNYLKFNEDGSYELFRDNEPIRRGVWKYDEKTKTLEMQTKKNHFFYEVTTLFPNRLEMTEPKKGYKLVYIPYQE